MLGETEVETVDDLDLPVLVSGAVSVVLELFFFDDPCLPCVEEEPKTDLEPSAVETMRSFLLCDIVVVRLLWELPLRILRRKFGGFAYTRRTGEGEKSGEERKGQEGKGKRKEKRKGKGKGTGGGKGYRE